MSLPPVVLRPFRPVLGLYAMLFHCHKLLQAAPHNTHTITNFPYVVGPWVDYVGWPTFWWDNDKTEGWVASGRHAVDPGIDHTPFLYEYAKTGEDEGIYLPTDKGTFNIASQERWYRDAPLFL